MKNIKILQTGLAFIFVFNLLSSTAFAQVPIDIQARVDKVPEIKACFEEKIKAKENDIKTIKETLPKCKTDALKTAETAAKDYLNICTLNRTEAVKECNKITDSNKKTDCLATAENDLSSCVKNMTAAYVTPKKIEIEKACEKTATDDEFNIYDTAENECNSKYASEHQGLTPTSSGVDPTKGPELKPETSDLLYKFSYPGSTEVVTTDYVSSLPEEETPGHILGQIIYFMLVVANILAFISFLVAGVFMLISQGNEDDNTKAKKILTYTILALIICATALAIVSGVTKLNFFSP
ncbi:pilin [Patescibacteria group bacterium]